MKFIPNTLIHENVDTWISPQYWLVYEHVSNTSPPLSYVEVRRAENTDECPEVPLAPYFLVPDYPTAIIVGCQLMSALDGTPEDAPEVDVENVLFNVAKKYGGVGRYGVCDVATYFAKQNRAAMGWWHRFRTMFKRLGPPTWQKSVLGSRRKKRKKGA